MENMTFLHIGKESEGISIPVDHFEAIRVKNENGDMVYLPIIIERYGYPDDVWGYGLGRFRLKNRKRYTIPVFDGEADHWRDYEQTYGRRCMYYSLTGKCMQPGCDMDKREFLSICAGDPTRYSAFSSAYIRINEIQHEKISSIDQYEDVCFDCDWCVWEKDLLFYPEFTIYGFAFPFTPDVESDDRKTAKLYRIIRRRELFKSHRDYAAWKTAHDEYSQYCEKLNKYCDGHPSDDEWIHRELLKTKAHEIARPMVDDVVKQVADEIEYGCTGFPICMKDRLRIMYGDELTELYAGLVGDGIKEEKKKTA